MTHHVEFGVTSKKSETKEESLMTIRANRSSVESYNRNIHGIEEDESEVVRVNGSDRNRNSDNKCFSGSSSSNSNRNVKQNIEYNVTTRNRRKSQTILKRLNDTNNKHKHSSKSTISQKLLVDVFRREFVYRKASSVVVDSADSEVIDRSKSIISTGRESTSTQSNTKIKQKRTKPLTEDSDSNSDTDETASASASSSSSSLRPSSISSSSLPSPSSSTAHEVPLESSLRDAFSGCYVTRAPTQITNRGSILREKETTTTTTTTSSSSTTITRAINSNILSCSHIDNANCNRNKLELNQNTRLLESDAFNSSNLVVLEKKGETFKSFNDNNDDDDNRKLLSLDEKSSLDNIKIYDSLIVGLSDMKPEERKSREENEDEDKKLIVDNNNIISGKKEVNKQIKSNNNFKTEIIQQEEEDKTVTNSELLAKNEKRINHKSDDIINRESANSIDSVLLTSLMNTENRNSNSNNNNNKVNEKSDYNNDDDYDDFKKFEREKEKEDISSEMNTEVNNHNEYIIKTAKDKLQNSESSIKLESQNKIILRPQRKLSVFSPSGFVPDLKLISDKNKINIPPFNQQQVEVESVKMTVSCQLKKEQQESQHKSQSSEPASPVVASNNSVPKIPIETSKSTNKVQTRRSTRLDTFGSTGSSRASSCDEPTISANSNVSTLASSSKSLGRDSMTIDDDDDEVFDETSEVEIEIEQEQLEASERNELNAKSPIAGVSTSSSSSLDSMGWTDQQLTGEQIGSSGELVDGNNITISDSSVTQREQPKFESIKSQLKDKNQTINAQVIKRHIDKLISQNEAIIDNWNLVSIRSYNHSANKSEGSQQKRASTTNPPTSQSLELNTNSASSNIIQATTSTSTSTSTQGSGSSHHPQPIKRWLSTSEHGSIIMHNNMIARPLSTSSSPTNVLLSLSPAACTEYSSACSNITNNQQQQQQKQQQQQQQHQPVKLFDAFRPKNNNQQFHSQQQQQQKQQNIQNNKSCEQNNQGSSISRKRSYEVSNRYPPLINEISQIPAQMLGAQMDSLSAIIQSHQLEQQRLASLCLEHSNKQLLGASRDGVGLSCEPTSVGSFNGSTSLSAEEQAERRWSHLCLSQPQQVALSLIGSGSTRSTSLSSAAGPAHKASDDNNRHYQSIGQQNDEDEIQNLSLRRLQGEHQSVSNVRQQQQSASLANVVYNIDLLQKSNLMLNPPAQSLALSASSLSQKHHHHQHQQQQQQQQPHSQQSNQQQQIDQQIAMAIAALQLEQQQQQQFNQLRQKQKLEQNQMIEQQQQQISDQLRQIRLSQATQFPNNQNNNHQTQEQQMAVLKDFISALNCQRQATMTMEHSGELLTQSLDSATPGYKCQSCNLPFWTRDLLNYHQLTQCTGLRLSLGLVQNRVNQLLTKEANNNIKINNQTITDVNDQNIQALNCRHEPITSLSNNLNIGLGLGLGSNTNSNQSSNLNINQSNHSPKLSSPITNQPVAFLSEPIIKPNNNSIRNPAIRVHRASDIRAPNGDDLSPLVRGLRSEKEENGASNDIHLNGIQSQVSRDNDVRANIVSSSILFPHESLPLKKRKISAPNMI